ncbi:MAG TPA: DNA-binding domain-containing protein [Verrucomicrobiae bacterium]|nr:DNA-binding domain-containing protein [Verrucomicrobiae bacterium]
MKLLSLQRRMARAVMAPLTASEHMRSSMPDGRSMRRVAASFIKPNDRLTSFERLEIYNRQYWWRVLDSFAEDFPGLRAILGDRKFDAVAKAYIASCPSRSFTLRNLGSSLAHWLARHPRFAGSRQRLAVDMVRLEWADIEAFDGGAEPAFSPADLGGADPSKLRLGLQPHITLLALRYPVDDLLLKVRKEEDTAFASNTFTERRKRKHVSAVARLRPASIFLAVHRHDESVYFRRLGREEFSILAALRSGKTLRRSVDLAMRPSKIAAADRPAMVERWFRTWASFGWFCIPAKRRSGS